MVLKALKKCIPLQARNAAKTILGLSPAGAGRSLTVRDSDIFIVSYPKSGNTWTRFLIGNLVYEDGVDFINIEDRIPDIYVNSDRMMGRLQSPRILKSHEYFDARYKKVIYIVRDPRDVLVSYWHFAKKRNDIAENTTLDTFAEMFLYGGMHDFGTWGENVGSWLGARGNDKNFLLLRYEDLLGNPVGELERAARLIGVCLDGSHIQRAVERSTFDRMQELEKIQGKQWKAIRNSRQDIKFVRSGKSGGWQEVLSEQAAAFIQDAWGATMEKLGYL